MKERITLGLLIDQLVSGYAPDHRRSVQRQSEPRREPHRVFGKDPRDAERARIPEQCDLRLHQAGHDRRPGDGKPEHRYRSSRSTTCSRTWDGYKGIPLVSIGMRLEGVPSILTDNRAGILEAMDHLIDVHGLRRIAFLKGPEINHEAQERFAAYREALRGARARRGSRAVASGRLHADERTQCACPLLPPAPKAGFPRSCRCQ